MNGGSFPHPCPKTGLSGPRQFRHRRLPQGLAKTVPRPSRSVHHCFPTSTHLR